MTGRLLEFCDLRKEGVYKPLHPPVAVDVGLRPVIGNENGAHSDRIHLAGRNEFRIIVVGKGRRQVIAVQLIQLLGIGDRDKMQPVIAS